VRFTAALLPALAASAALSCRATGDGAPAPADPVAAAPAPELVIPGSVSGPDSTGVLRAVDPVGAEAVLLYYWLPLEGYEESGPDLRFLAAVQGDAAVLVLPVQFDQASRNHAQTLVNGLGITLTVYMGDSALLGHMSPEMLPLSVLLRPGSEIRETGFGGPERLLTGAGCEEEGN
jgi:hypothetical protein